MEDELLKFQDTDKLAYIIKRLRIEIIELYGEVYAIRQEMSNKDCKIQELKDLLKEQNKKEIKQFFKKTKPK